MATRIQHGARALTGLYLLAATVGVIVPIGQRIGTFKYNIGYRLTGGVTPIGARPLTGDQVATVGDHALNLFMLFPLACLATLGWPKVRWWKWGVAATIIGICSETAQYALPQLGRRPLISNAVENAAGGWVGAGIAGYFHHLGQRTSPSSDRPNRKPSERCTHQ
ncbi:VanZ family protein [Cutibacterium equinum]|uniref:VanZ family protein n=1 Tax=Cutibacterium equinum TaxID=3016342 RepID=A0ABY7QYM3_9ACTN|nr:VanZ family protein [Cutibacterium equinum]WCC80137.1 VanZ family protein [Cutibacterium equinum]